MTNNINNTVINEYLLFVIETLSDWADGAKNILNIAAATVTSLTKRRLKNINTAITRLKEDFKVLFDAYKEIENEYELKPFSIEYYNAYNIQSLLLVLYAKVMIIENKYSMVMFSSR